MNLVRAFFPKSGHVSLNFGKGQGGPPPLAHLVTRLNNKRFLSPDMYLEILDNAWSFWLVFVTNSINVIFKCEVAVDKNS